MGKKGYEIEIYGLLIKRRQRRNSLRTLMELKQIFSIHPKRQYVILFSILKIGFSHHQFIPLI
jgi:hypothetical protein